MTNLILKIFCMPGPWSTLITQWSLSNKTDAETATTRPSNWHVDQLVSLPVTRLESGLRCLYACGSIGDRQTDW